jgi:hypothetical protein
MLSSWRLVRHPKAMGQAPKKDMESSPSTTPQPCSVANMASYAISSSLILVIHDNMINETNHIVEHVFVDISRFQRCKNTTCQNEKIVYFSRVKTEKGKEKE